MHLVADKLCMQAGLLGIGEVDALEGTDAGEGLSDGNRFWLATVWLLSGRVGPAILNGLFCLKVEIVLLRLF